MHAENGLGLTLHKVSQWQNPNPILPVSSLKGDLKEIQNQQMTQSPFHAGEDTNLGALPLSPI